MTNSLAPDVVDLNALVPARKKVALGSRTYEIPGDMPMEVYLRAQASFSSDDEFESTNNIKQAFQDLMLWYVPLGEEGAAVRRELDNDIRPLGVRTIMALLGGIYRDGDADEEAGEDAAGESSAATMTEAAIPTTTGTSSNESSPTPNSETPSAADSAGSL